MKIEESLFIKVDNLLQQIEKTRVNTSNRPIVSNRRFGAGVVKCIKRIVRRMIFWHTEPGFQQQTEYNNAVASTLGHLTAMASTPFHNVQQNEHLIRQLLCEQNKMKDDFNKLILNIIQGQLAFNPKEKLNLELHETKSTPFFWVTHGGTTDPISKAARAGYVPFEQSLFTLFPTPGTFIDIGANIGAFSLLFASKGWDGYAFEASHANILALKASIALNRFDIIAVKTAVFDRTGSISFIQNGPWGQVVFNELGDTIQCTTMDDWVTANPVENVKLIKMDIEGSELAALKGMHKFLEKLNYPPIYTEVNALALCSFGETQKSYLAYAQKLGYTPYSYSDGYLTAFDGNVLPEVVYTDYLLIHNMPDEWLGIIKEPTPPLPFNEVISRLANRLDNRKNWALDEPYILYALKDYPEYYNEPTIKQRLTEIAKEPSDNPYMEKSIGWYIGL